jgi:ADP-heptose:LPS heptosyltransferase
MPDYTFLQLGLPDEHALKGAVDLRGKISLRESMAVVKYSKGVVCVDTFFGHVAQAMNKPSVTLFGASNPEIWGYPGNVNLYKKVACAPCIDVLGDDPCPYHRKCMQQIETREVVAAIAARILPD